MNPDDPKFALFVLHESRDPQKQRDAEIVLRDVGTKIEQTSKGIERLAHNVFWLTLPKAMPALFRLATASDDRELSYSLRFLDRPFLEHHSSKPAPG